MVMLKKCLSLLMAVLLLCGIATGCSGDGAGVTPTDITDEIFTYVDKDIVWVSLGSDELNGYFGFSGEALSDHSAYINDAEEKYDIVAAFEFKDIDSLRSAAEKVSARLVAATANFASTIDSERDKISNRLILSKGNLLVVVVSSNAPKIKEMLIEKGFSVVM